MARRKLATVAGLALACLMAASTADSWTPVKHFGDDKYIHGVVQEIDSGDRTITILNDSGTPVEVRFEEDTVFIVRDRQVQSPDLRAGMSVTVRCVSVLGEEARQEGGLCPIAVIADRVILEGPVAVSSEESPGPNP